MNYIRTVYNFSLQLLLATFPLSTAWVYFEPTIGGVKWQYGTLLWYASEALLALCVVACCLYLYTHHIRGKQIQFRWTTERLFVLTLALGCGYLYIRSAFTLYPDIAFQQSVHVLEAVLFFFCLMLSPLENKVLLRALVIGAVLQAVLGITQFALQTTWSSTLLGTSAHAAAEAGSSVVVTGSERWLRAYGMFVHPNVYGGYLALVLLIALQHYSTTTQKHLIRYVLIILLTIGIFVSFSRSAWIALFVGLLILSFRPKRPEGVKWRNRFLTSLSQNEVKDSITTSKGSLGFARDDKNVTRYTLHVTSAATFVILSALFHPLITTRLGVTSLNEQQSITERVSGSREAIELIKDNLMFGVGPGQYTAAAMQQDPNRPVWEYQPVHNVPLLFFAELGVVGVLLFALCFAFFVKTSQIQFVDVLYGIPLVPLVLFDHYVWSSLAGLSVFVVYIAMFCMYKKVNTRQ